MKFDYLSNIGGARHPIFMCVNDKVVVNLCGFLCMKLEPEPEFLFLRFTFKSTIIKGV